MKEREREAGQRMRGRVWNGVCEGGAIGSGRGWGRERGWLSNVKRKNKRGRYKKGRVQT